MTDLLIRGATVVDGTGVPGIRASVAVDRGRIASILTNGRRPEADRIVDADGLVLAPGFIDMHSHADFTLPSYPAAINSLAQGVTTEVIGNCGYSPAPLSSDPALAAQPAVNVIALVGHGMVRLSVVGPAARPATGPELDRMRAAADAALADGA